MSADAPDKVRRQDAIIALVMKKTVGTQEGMRRALDRLGYPVTQATLSRDLKELRIVRVPTQDGYRYEIAGSPAAEPADAAVVPGRMRAVASAEVRKIESNETTVIVFTLSGRAQGVAVYIDTLKLEDVLATVAGDDTILIVPRSVKKTKRVREQLAELFGLA